MRERGVYVNHLVRWHDAYGSYDWAVARGTDNCYLICSEGVAYMIPDIVVELMLSNAEYVKLVDLADFVREFGSRLEGNFNMLFHALSGRWPKLCEN